MRHTCLSRLILAGCLLILLAGCASPTTGAVATATQVGTPDPAPLSPTEPPATPTVSPTPTAHPPLTGTPLPATPPPTATATPQASAPERLECDFASLVGDINVPAGTTLTAGTQFIKTWRIKNTGACAWTTDYGVVFDAGDPMDGPGLQKLESPVPPGATLDISLVLQAPGQPGSFHSQWKLRNAAGAAFGLGIAQDQPLSVDIHVQPARPVGTGPMSTGYDFLANDCKAEWFSNNRATACLGNDGDANGFILTRLHPILENGYIDDQPALLMSPPINENGFIYGRYPAFTVQANDHFASIIGCEHNAKNCNVRFRLDYQIDNRPVQTLAAWDQVYDGKFETLDVDLSSLAGMNVQFILTVMANGTSDQNRALWLLPRIIR